MKKTTVTVSCDEEKLSALRLYLARKNLSVEKELEKSLDTLYAKIVPAGVREFLELSSEENPASAVAKPKKRNPSRSTHDGAVREDHEPE